MGVTDGVIRRYNMETGMYNYGYRDYKAEAGRFTLEDPVKDGNNWYAYVNNNPVNWVDPWGLECSASDKSNSKVNSPTAYIYTKTNIISIDRVINGKTVTTYYSTDKERLEVSRKQTSDMPYPVKSQNPLTYVAPPVFPGHENTYIFSNIYEVNDPREFADSTVRSLPNAPNELGFTPIK
jgi:uncharacterized protein RhaS with RHS repeats